MKHNGSLYVVLVVVAVTGYFTYQWWFNPSRAVKRRLGEIAEALSTPASETDLARMARLARLRKFFAEDVRAHQGPAGPEITSRDALVAAIGAWAAPPLGRDVQFVDVQISVDSDSAARAFLTIELITRDERSRQPVADSGDVNVRLAKQKGEWVVTGAEPYVPPARD